MHLKVALEGRSLPVVVAYQVVSECSVHSGAPPALPAPVRRASRCALGADGADGTGAARPGACSEPDRRCVPLRQAGQPLAANAASRYVLGPDGMRARAPSAARGRGIALRARRRALRCAAVRTRAPTCPPPANLRMLDVASWWWGCRRRRAAARCSRHSDDSH